MIFCSSFHKAFNYHILVDFGGIKRVDSSVLTTVLQLTTADNSEIYFLHPNLNHQFQDTMLKVIISTRFKFSLKTISNQSQNYYHELFSAVNRHHLPASGFGIDPRS